MEQSAEIALQIPRLRRYARALTGEHAAADDLVQDTLERALSKFHLWRPGSNMRAWVFTIMHNVYVNQLRARIARPERESDDAAFEVQVRADQDDALEIRDLHQALRQLPDEQREVLLLVGLEQLTYGETAKVLGIPIGTVMSRLARGRERLRAALAGKPVVTHLKAVK
ncbi:MAG: sigma-70 family RNA polymerase sigma factor [Betaproteobacteria bacterium]|nr:sigma-70 family RNA polymerase sigma factor [Betaproteobacteria bacterium]